MANCVRCDAPIVRRDNERLGRWLKRIYCSRICSDAAKKENASQDAMARFHASYEIRDNGCWEWTGQVNQARGGYGSFYLSSATHRAHRFGYERLRGPIPDGLVLRHKCDNPRCVNPDHLEPGTSAENSQDTRSRRRHMHGNRHSHAKITEADAVEISRSAEPGSLLAIWYGVSRATITNIRKGKVWGHATGRPAPQKDNGL